MKKIHSLCQFLGSFYFALIIIVALALFVAAGTFAESLTDSHQFAARYTYNHPLFTAILFALFTNILFSSLRRWPFRKKHIPFLITHLGLLMLISGVIIKNLWGVQGNMSLIEGGCCSEILIPHTQVIHVEKRDPNHPTQLQGRDYPLSSLSNHDPLHLEIVEYHLHSEERWLTWIKNNQGVITGLEPFPLSKYKKERSTVPISSKVKLFPHSDEIWDFFALSTDHVEDVIRQLILQDQQVWLIHKNNKERLIDYQLEISLDHNTLHEAYLKTAIGNFSLHSDSLFTNLLQREERNTVTGEKLSIHTQPKIALIQTEEEETYLVAIDRYSNLFIQFFQSQEISPLTVYDEGFGGYYVTATLPFPLYDYDGNSIHFAKLNELSQSLRRNNINKKELPTPLQLLYQACEETKSDFYSLLARLLADQPSSELLSTLHVFDFSKLSKEKLKLSYWASVTQRNLEKEIKLPNFFSKIKTEEDLLKYIEAVSFDLPEISFSHLQDPLLNTKILQNYLLLYGISEKTLSQKYTEEKIKKCYENYLKCHNKEQKLAAIFPPLTSLPLSQKIASLTQLKEQHKEIAALIDEERDLIFQLPVLSTNRPLHYEENLHLLTFETAIFPKQIPLPPSRKLEQNRPAVTLFATNGKTKQFLSLGYSPSTSSIHWPGLFGEYRFSFRPQTKEIPYEVWLHDARQINYPKSTQPMSYECDITIKDKRSGIIEEVTLSMNKVYESAHGYRFYLANITPGDETAVQHVQIIVNHDPAKYFLTYPGGIFIALGTILLFWFRFYR